MSQPPQPSQPPGPWPGQPGWNQPSGGYPEAVARAAATAFEDGDVDVDEMVALACQDEADAGFRDDFDRMATDTGPTGGPQGQVESAAVDQIIRSEGSSGYRPSAVARIVLTYDNGSTRKPVLLMSNENGGWCVSGISY